MVSNATGIVSKEQGYSKMTSNELKELRLKKKYTQKELAERLGYFLDSGVPNSSQIARFENNHAPINKRVELAIRYIFL